MNINETTPFIFESLFQVKCPAYEIPTLEEIEELGTPTTLDDDFDRALQFEPVVLYLPISKIATMFGNGSNISIPRSTDVARMYEYIQNHLEAWKQYINGRDYYKNPPVDDLLALDSLAERLYVPAGNKRAENTEEKAVRTKTSGRTRQYGVGGRRINAFVREDTRPSYLVNERISYAEFFKSAIRRER